jgi:hypothetical protein
VSVALTAAGCGKSKPPAVAAHVNGAPVTSADVERLTIQYISASAGSTGETLPEGAPLKPLAKKTGRR